VSKRPGQKRGSFRVATNRSHQSLQNVVTLIQANTLVMVTESKSTLNEWANFLSVLNGNARSGSPVIPNAHDPYRMIGHLEKRFPVVRKYKVGKQMSLFAN
jgi:hypothetical protein